MATEAAQPSDDSALGEGPDYYASHLAEVDQTNAVVSTEDIFNKRGALVVRKGSRIDRGVAERILQHKLFKPLHEVVQLSSLMDNTALQGQFQSMLGHFPDMQTLLEGVGLQTEFLDQVAGTLLPPLLAQNLTVLFQQRPDIFEKGLFAAALSALMARELDQDRHEVATAYLAALTHDIGLLRIRPDILDQQGALSAEDWRAIQSHVVVGRVLLENIPGLPPGVAAAVLEHHERCDGSGYPAGKTSEQLGMNGQIVGMADSLQAIRVNKFQGLGLNLANALPYLQMNDTTHFYEVYEVIQHAIKRAGIKAARHDPEQGIAGLAEQLLAHARALTRVLPPLEQVNTTIADFNRGRAGRTVARLSERVLGMIHTSGLLREELIDWISQVKAHPEPELLEELNVIDLMQQELRWQLGSLRRSLDGFLDTDGAITEGTRATLAASLEEISGCLQGLQS